MYNSLGQKNKQYGYTLIEFAITMIVIGLLAAPAIAFYHQYKIAQDREDMKNAVAESLSALGDFRAVYGRYPCPSPYGLAPGDVKYGHEDCGASLSAASQRAGSTDNVLIGALPFKSMNMQEEDSYDPYGMKLSYAVTKALTVSNTFTMDGGGISIEDENGSSLITPDDSAHFVVFSHGEDSVGGYTRSGVLHSACAAGTKEAENCDGDSVFVSMLAKKGYDDYTGYFTAEDVSEWETQTNSPANIHMKNANEMILGIIPDPNADLSNTETAAIRTLGTDTGGVRAEENFYSNDLCQYGENIDPSTDCFQTSLLTEHYAPGNGLVCPSGYFFKGIDDHKQPICDRYLEIKCDAGSYMAGVDSNGRIICRGNPPPPCESTTVTGFCGDTYTLPQDVSTAWNYQYAGKCYRFPAGQNHDFFETGVSGKSQTEIEDWVNNTLNNVDRVQSSCASDADHAQIRDFYVCNAGTWEHIKSHERWRYYTPQFPGWPYSDSNTAENNFPWSTYSKSIDRYNSSGQHDCWCREDYKVDFPSCGNGLSGYRVRIRKLLCPQTAANGFDWQTVYDNDDHCACSPYTAPPETQSCKDYYNSLVPHADRISGYQMRGTVYKTYHYSCVNGNPQKDPTPISIDTSECGCPSHPFDESWTYCPQYTTNDFNWTFDGHSYHEHGIASIQVKKFICPGGTSVGGLPTPGYWQDPATDISVPPCTCDSGAYKDVVEDCPIGKEGTKIVRYMQTCPNVGTFENTGTVIGGGCHGCKWNAGNPGEDSDVRLGGALRQVTHPCDCGTPTAEACWADGGASKPYKTYSQCQCVVDPND